MTKKVDQQVAELQNKVEELEQKWKRALADYHNLKRRTEEEKTNFIRFASAAVVLKFVPILENMEKIGTSGSAQFDQGTAMIIRQFYDMLKSEGIEPIAGEGQQFDPTKHEAVETVEGATDNIIVSIVAPGWTMRGSVIQPAKVRVSKHHELIDTNKSDEPVDVF